MSDILRRVLPHSLFSFLRNLKHRIVSYQNYLYDWRRFKAHCLKAYYLNTMNASQANLMMNAHIIEKGLTLPAPRVGFGQEVVRSLIKMTKEYLDNYGPDEIICISVNVLSAYHDFNQQKMLDDKNLLSAIDGLKAVLASDCLESNVGGVIPITRESVIKASKSHFKEFSRERHSIRNFTDEPVAQELIEEAVNISLKSPSVCNRQAWRVHYYHDRENCQKILKYQNGNRGFNHTISSILVVTCDLNYFLSIRERNQPFIDGGMFSMTLVYALHYLGLGTCCLNLSFSAEQDKAMRNAAKIPDQESLILMLAVGHLPESLFVARSCRKPLNEILIVHHDQE